MTTTSSDWSDSQKAALVQRLVAGALTPREACDQYGLSPAQLKEWVRIFRRSLRQALDEQLRSTLALQGLEVEELCSAEFSGALPEIAIADVIQTIHMGRKDARVTIQHSALESHIWCQGGEIIDAECGPLRGEEALFRILGLERGSLSAHFTVVDRQRRITLSTPRLLLEAASRDGERARLLRRVGDTGEILSVNAKVAACNAAELGPEELDVLSAFDGARSVEQVLMASPLPDVQLLAIAARFVEGGLLERTGVQSVPGAGAVSGPTSFQPLVGTVEPVSNRAPLWALAAGAAICSSLGAATAIAYANANADAAGADTVAAASDSSSARAAAVEPRRCPSGMVLIRGGKFFMGSDSSHPALQWARPAHEVSVDSYCLDAHEVTVERYADCVRSGQCDPAHATSSFDDEEAAGSSTRHSEALHSEQCNAGKPGRERHPINCVSFHQASRYCSWSGARLATEAEWEYAARGDQNRLFPWGQAQPTADHINACGTECRRWHENVDLTNELHGLMYEEDDGYSGTAPVGSFPLGSTSDGVADLIGNVFEWTAGGLYAYDRQARTNPVGPSDSDSFVIRGGNFNSGIPEFSDPALRFAMRAESYSHGVGFRCAADFDGAARGATTEPPSSASRAQ